MEYKRIVFNGQAYNWDGKYYSPVGGCKDGRKRLHQAVWEYHNGKIEQGYCIHHINKDKADNRIENLVKLGRREHQINHWLENWEKPEFREKVLEHARKIRPLTKAWHASKEGLEWHKEHAIQQWKQQKQTQLSQ